MVWSVGEWYGPLRNGMVLWGRGMVHWGIIWSVGELYGSLGNDTNEKGNGRLQGKGRLSFATGGGMVCKEMIWSLVEVVYSAGNVILFAGE